MLKSTVYIRLCHNITMKDLNWRYLANTKTSPFRKTDKGLFKAKVENRHPDLKKKAPLNINQEIDFNKNIQ